MSVGNRKNMCIKLTGKSCNPELNCFCCTLTMHVELYLRDRGGYGMVRGALLVPWSKAGSLLPANEALNCVWWVDSSCCDALEHFTVIVNLFQGRPNDARTRESDGWMAWLFLTFICVDVQHDDHDWPSHRLAVKSDLTNSNFKSTRGHLISLCSITLRSKPLHHD